jgi:hypothetical protein
LSTPSRRRNGIAIGTLAACAVIGGTSPVWAGVSGHAASSPEQASNNTTSADAATIAVLRAEVAKLTDDVKADHLALQQATKAEHAAVQAADKSRHLAAHWRHTAHTRPATRTVVVTKAVPATSDPDTHKRCHHGDGDADHAQWSNDPRWHHHCHHGDDPNGYDGHGYDGHGHGNFGH